MYIKKNTSFTLIELLVVIVIIGILAGVIMISTSSSIDKASIAKLKVFEENVSNSLAANMVSRWKLDDRNGVAPSLTTSDSWGNNTGTLYGSGGTQSYPELKNSSECITDGCFKFDGTDDYVWTATSNLAATQSKTISVWFRLGADGVDLPNSQPLVTVNYFRLYVRTSVNTVQARYDYVGSAIAAIHTCGAGDRNWHHAIGVYYKENSTNYVKIYIDGLFKNSNSTTNDPTVSNSGDFGIAKISTGYFTGSIDDVRLYDGALSSSQVRQNYIAGLDSLLTKESISKEEYNQRILYLSEK